MDPQRPPTGGWLLTLGTGHRGVVTVHAKRTYALTDNGRCIRQEQEAPLLLRPLSEPNGNGAFFETDVMPQKPGVDLIVLATVYGRGRRVATPSIRISSAGGPPRRFDYLVQGSRRCSYRGPGTLAFSKPEPFDTVEMRYENAFGGVDPTAAPERPIDTLLDFLEHHPGLYPRNPVGMGYAVTANQDRLDGLALPHIEHPRQLLTSDNLIAGDGKSWWRKPIPWSCDWFGKGWFPRCLYLGVKPEHLPTDTRELVEVQRGLIPQGLLTHEDKSRIHANLFQNAATPALVLPDLRPSAAVNWSSFPAKKNWSCSYRASNLGWWFAVVETLRKASRSYNGP